MTTLDELMAAGVPDKPKQQKARLTLTAMAIAATATTAAGTTAFARSDLPQLFAGHHKSHTSAPAHQRAPAPAPGTAPNPGH
jgi:hypothetical protein